MLVRSRGRCVPHPAPLTSRKLRSPQDLNRRRPLARPIRPVHHTDRCLLQRHVQSDIVLHCRSPSLRGHMRLASYVPGELIPLPLSGSIPELPHVAKVFSGCRTKILRATDAFYARRREGPYRFIQNRSRTSVVTLKSGAAGEKSKDRLSRDF